MSFVPFQKIPRYSREVVVTEKIDGTNASITILPKWEAGHLHDKVIGVSYQNDPKDDVVVLAGSRSRFVTPDDDNYGFASWVKENFKDLLNLGVGTHYGEWWGQKIQRGYGLKEKRFSLFNVSRWYDRNNQDRFPMTGARKAIACPDCCYVVPVLWAGSMDQFCPDAQVYHLSVMGSYAAPGFMDPEGIIIYHTAANSYFKKTIKDDAKPKSA